MNYFDTFIEVAEDCPVTKAIVPTSKDQSHSQKKTMPVLQYEMLADQPYQYTQEDVLFETYARHKALPLEDRLAQRYKFFSTDQACLRSSALGKRYGWGIHCNGEGKLALYPVESAEYQQLANDPNLKHLKAFRSKRA